MVVLASSQGLTLSLGGIQWQANPSLLLPLILLIPRAGPSFPGISFPALHFSEAHSKTAAIRAAPSEAPHLAIYLNLTASFSSISRPSAILSQSIRFLSFYSPMVLVLSGWLLGRSLFLVSSFSFPAKVHFWLAFFV